MAEPQRHLADVAGGLKYVHRAAMPQDMGDIALAASEGTTPAAAAACFASIYSKPERVVARLALFRKSTNKLL